MGVDFLVVGSGIAGLSFSLKVASLGSVCLITKKRSFISTVIQTHSLSVIIAARHSVVSKADIRLHCDTF